MSEQTGEGGEREQRRVWILVDHSAKEEALLPVADELESRGVEVELVTITEVIGNVAREALAGGAERLLRGLRVAMRGNDGDEDLIGAIRRRQPDALVVTQPRYARAIGVLENLSGVESLQVGLVTDFYADRLWFEGEFHAFVVADDELAGEFADRGIDDERVRIGGPPIRSGFHGEVGRKEARAELGLDVEEPVVLVRADGFDTSTVDQLVFQCTLADRDLRVVFHHDGDGAVASTLRRAADQYGLSAAMFGRVADFEKYVAAADATIASDVDPYLPELLAAGTPGLVISTGGKANNGEALSDRGVVDHLSDIGQLGTRLDRLTDPERLQELREALAGWDGAGRHERLVDGLEEIIDRADEWRRPARSRPTAADDEKTDADESGTTDDRGPFESIGGGENGQRAPDETADEERSRRRDFTSLSRAEAKDQLAELILKEREAERQLRELEKQQERWRGRLELAREWNESDLAEEAKSILRGYVEDAEPVEERLEDIRRQKQKLKKAAGAGGSGEDLERAEGRIERLEERFREMEVDSDLEGLKDRIRRELGE